MSPSPVDIQSFPSLFQMHAEYQTQTIALVVVQNAELQIDQRKSLYMKAGISSLNSDIDLRL